MFARFVRIRCGLYVGVTPNICRRTFSVTSRKNFRVAVVGSAGGIGQPLSMLLKLDPMVTSLGLYDIHKMNPGIAMDISHINTRVMVQASVGPEQIHHALTGAHIVVIPAGLPRKPGMSRDDLFNANASLIYDMACAIARYCPCALVAIVTNPVNSMVPIMSEVLMRVGCYDPCKIFGVTTLDVLRAATFVGELSCMDPSCIDVPVIGGHAGKTIIPVLSRANPPLPKVDQKAIEHLTKRIQEGGTEVVKAKAGGGSATLSTAFATYRFVRSLMRGLSGESCIVECAYVRSNCTEAPFFANPVLLGRYGMEMNLGYGKINEYENQQLCDAIPTLLKNYDVAAKFIMEKICGSCAPKEKPAPKPKPKSVCAAKPKPPPPKPKCKPC